MTPQSTLSDRKRQAILDAALAEFDNRGFNATSMDQVAARANVSKRTVYNHFGSKDELFAAIRGRLFAQIADIQFEYDPEKDLRDQLQSIAKQQVELVCSDAFRKFARISIPLSIQSAEIAETTFDAFHEANRAIRRLVKRATQDGRLRAADSRFVVRQFVGLIHANVLWPQLLGGQKKPGKQLKQRVAETTVAMFLGHFAVEDALADGD